VDTIKFAPSYFYMRNRCKAAGSEVIFDDIKLGYGSCNKNVGPTLRPSPLPSPSPTQSFLPTIAPSFVPYPLPTSLPSSVPTEHDWPGDRRPSPAPTTLPSAQPTITMSPTITPDPSSLPSISMSPTHVPTIQPTTRTFTCGNLWPELVPDIEFPFIFNDTQTKWADVFGYKNLYELNMHELWEVNETWTLQLEGTSTCSNGLTFSFSGSKGSLNTHIPANAVDFEITVVDRLEYVPSYLFMRNRCQSPSQVTFTS
jgi:hypothetical protein